ncbi:hypothetical protein Ciccas_012158 [Cichlidogyrus casuarinus]|uniref:Uncharacterized protein n=1 Tax=Cichlidogyrus casuarinus TaxID=1844966 RepID=A0ABD2PS88_9PLAT
MSKQQVSLKLATVRELVNQRKWEALGRLFLDFRYSLHVSEAFLLGQFHGLSCDILLSRESYPPVLLNGLLELMRLVGTWQGQQAARVKFHQNRELQQALVTVRIVERIPLTTYSRLLLETLRYYFNKSLPYCPYSVLFVAKLILCSFSKCFQEERSLDVLLSTEEFIRDLFELEFTTDLVCFVGQFVDWIMFELHRIDLQSIIALQGRFAHFWRINNLYSTKKGYSCKRQATMLFNKLLLRTGTEDQHFDFMHPGVTFASFCLMRIDQDSIKRIYERLDTEFYQDICPYRDFGRVMWMQKLESFLIKLREQSPAHTYVIHPYLDRIIKLFLIFDVREDLDDVLLELEKFMPAPSTKQKDRLVMQQAKTRFFTFE